MQFLDVKTDYAFKKVFGSEESKSLLIELVSTIKSNIPTIDEYYIGYCIGYFIGIEQGIEKGIKKHNIDIAIKAIAQGLDNQTISLLTGLDLVQIDTLR